MPKVTYENITFDSELEVEYYKYLIRNFAKGIVLDFFYHPDSIPSLVGKRSYQPDFLVLYEDRIEIVETKGYNPYSKMIDDQIHNVMQAKSTRWLASYVLGNLSHRTLIARHLDQWNATCLTDNVYYKKVKYLKAYGFVDWDFKNPNTLANKRKEKINLQKDEIKELREFKKNAERYFKYHLKIVDNEKLTKQQKEWYYNYVKELREQYKNN